MSIYKKIELLQYVNTHDKVAVPSFIKKYLTKDLSIISPQIKIPAMFISRVCINARPVCANKILSEFPSLDWVTDCMEVIEKYSTVWYLGYDGFYIGRIEIYN